MAARRSREQYAAAAELGPLPEPIDAERRAACAGDFLRFLDTYFVSPDEKPLSEDHARVAEYLQRCGLGGGFYAQAIARGFAKTTIGIRWIVWLALYRLRRYAVLFGFDKGFARDLLDDVKRELVENELLEEDFPEVVLPLLAIGGNAQRATSQTHEGESTGAEWTSFRLVLPSTRVDWPNGGGMVIVARPRDNARGLRRRSADGSMQRPDVWLADDIQNDQTAVSPRVVEKQLTTILKSWMLLTGHHASGAGVVNGTVIAPGDVMAQLTDPSNPRFRKFQSQRLKMVRKWADAHDTLWEEYRELRQTYPSGDPSAQERAHARANDYYREHRAAMDAGSDVAWEHCYVEGEELSAIQHAYNLLFDLGADAFACECQNEPPEADHDFEPASPAIVVRKQHGLAPGVAPAETLKVTAYIDQQDDLLYWLVAAWCEGMTGWVVNYGSYPDQRRRYFTLANAKRRLSTELPGLTEEARLHRAITDLQAKLFATPWKTIGGASLFLDRDGIDTNYGTRSKLIRRIVEESPHRAQTLTGFGRGIGAKGRPMADWPKQRGEERGDEWLIRRAADSGVRHLIYETNHHKRATLEAVALPWGTPGAIALPKVADPAAHAMLADHLASEYGQSLKNQSTGREVLEFSLKPNEDNHLLDCLVGARVIALTLRVPTVSEAKRPAPPKRERKTVRARRL